LSHGFVWFSVSMVSGKVQNIMLFCWEEENLWYGFLVGDRTIIVWCLKKSEPWFSMV